MPLFAVEAMTCVQCVVEASTPTEAIELVKKSIKNGTEKLDWCISSKLLKEEKK